jgi:hypothetical protein
MAEDSELRKEDLAPFWLTRDEDAAGNLSELVSVWLEKPDLCNLKTGGRAWLGPGVTGLENRYAQWTLDVARSHCTIPDTVRECIKHD